MEAAEAEYFSKDFEWDELRAEVENDSSFRYHLLPFDSSTIPSSQTTTRSTTAVEEEDSTAWKRFHIRHSSGKFFKVLKLSSNSPSNFLLWVFFHFSLWSLFGVWLPRKLRNVSKPKGNWWVFFILLCIVFDCIYSKLLLILNFSKASHFF